MKSFVIVLIISWLSNGSLFAQTKKATIQKLDSLLQLVDTLPLEEKGAVYFELLRVEFSVTDRFEEVVQNVFEYAETNGIDSLKALAAQRSALRLINKGEHALARERLQISEDYFIQFNSERYKRLLVTTLVLKGYNLNRQNYVTEALKVFLQALPIAKEIKDLKRINNLHNRIINLYVAQEDYTKAFHYVDLITKSCAGREKKKCPFYLISQQTKANIYLAKNELDSARQVINDYFPLLPRQSMNSMLMNAYTAMGRLKRKEQQWE
ncbi:MAG: hypothetical protein AB8G22_18110, partial [Saprospiraceae bacterium]